MAFNFVLRRSASCLRPVAAQFLQTHKYYHAAVFTATNHGFLSRKTSLNPFSPTCHFSSVALKKPTSDENLLRVIESEIKCAEEADFPYSAEEITSNFPFKIHDSSGQQSIRLERTYQGEVITVEVDMPDLVSGERHDDRDDDNNDDAKRPSQSSIPLVVNVSKKGGPFLEFSCMAYPDKITIDNLAVKGPDNNEDEIAYEGPDFQDLDENLQKSFHRFLEIRGIKPSTMNVLHEYMINKDSREYLLWFKKLKKFVET